MNQCNPGVIEANRELQRYANRIVRGLVALGIPASTNTHQGYLAYTMPISAKRCMTISYKYRSKSCSGYECNHTVWASSRGCCASSPGRHPCLPSSTGEPLRGGPRSPQLKIGPLAVPLCLEAQLPILLWPRRSPSCRRHCVCLHRPPDGRWRTASSRSHRPRIDLLLLLVMRRLGLLLVGDPS